MTQITRYSRTILVTCCVLVWVIPAARCHGCAKAHRLLRDDPEVMASYAHGLCKLGHVARASKLLTTALAKLRHPTPDLAAQSLLDSWRRA